MEKQVLLIDIAMCFAKLGRQAVDGDRSEYDLYNWPALNCVHNRDLPRQERRAGLTRWLDHYKVLMGFTHEQRVTLSNAVLAWADQRNLNELPVTAQEIDAAHADLASTCCTAYQHKRSFVSLASKVLWLCYPDSIPIYDDFAKSSLQVLIQLVPEVVAARLGASEYEQFVHYWQQIFARYSGVFDETPAVSGDRYMHKAKIFDAVLWMLGRPGYTLPT